MHTRCLCRLRYVFDVYGMSLTIARDSWRTYAVLNFCRNVVGIFSASSFGFYVWCRQLTYARSLLWTRRYLTYLHGTHCPPHTWSFDIKGGHMYLTNLVQSCIVASAMCCCGDSSISIMSSQTTAHARFRDIELNTISPLHASNMSMPIHIKAF